MPSDQYERAPCRDAGKLVLEWDKDCLEKTLSRLYQLASKLVLIAVSTMAKICHLSTMIVRYKRENTIRHTKKQDKLFLMIKRVEICDLQKANKNPLKIGRGKGQK